MDRVRLHLGDSLEAMKQMDDKQFDLAIVDPPYGIGASRGVGVTRGKKNQYTVKDWDDDIPNEDYFIELFRVSKNQVIWGANHFTNYLQPSRGWIYWQKKMGGNYSDGELAFTSFDRVLKEFTKRSDQGNRFHPTQKPVKLYEWLLDNYAKEGDKILDTHLGSGSIAIACHNRGFQLDGWEIDEEYYNNAVKRLKTHQQQLTIF